MKRKSPAVVAVLNTEASGSPTVNVSGQIMTFIRIA